MLTHWIFVMFIGGQPVMTEQKASEADCNRTLVRVVALARAQGKDAVGACYLRATADQISSLRPKNQVISLLRRDVGGFLSRRERCTQY